jgi:DNA polymerase
LPPLIDAVVDFETYYDSDYTLKKLTIPQYVLDPRFQIIGMGLKLGNKPAQWFSGDLTYMLMVARMVPWARSRAIMHHAFFDAAILEWVLKVFPAQYFCTMMAARPFVTPYCGSMSLDRVGRHLELPTTKGDDVRKVMGLRREDFTREGLADYGRYCCNDVEMTGGIRRTLAPMLPQDELDLLDLTVKKFTRPKLSLDVQALAARQTDLATKRGFIEAKAQLLGASPEDLRSRPKFAAVLKKYGIKVPTKMSARTQKETFAFAKNDEAFIELLTHDDERVRTLVEAKLFTSSTLEHGRLDRFAALHDLNIGGKNLLPVPLLYYGAHPGRFSGYGGINLQNLPRVVRDKITKEIKAGHLRFALVAPPGYKVVAGDLSNIEARIVATLARCVMLIKAFRDKRDVYSEFATRIYGRAVTKANEIERFVGKTCILGLGYGMGYEKFALQMKIARVKMELEQAKRIVYLYRETYPQIQELWRTLEGLAYGMLNPKCLHPFGPVTFLHERILLPNGMPLIYPDLNRDPSTQSLTFLSRRGRTNGGTTTVKLWGGALTENIVQALARIVVATAELRLARAGLQAVLQVHDELVYVVKDEHVEKVVKALEMALTAPVSWMPELPLACEIKYGQTYGDAK